MIGATQGKEKSVLLARIRLFCETDFSSGNCQRPRFQARGLGKQKLAQMVQQLGPSQQGVVEGVDT